MNRLYIVLSTVIGLLVLPGCQSQSEGGQSSPMPPPPSSSSPSGMPSPPSAPSPSGAPSTPSTPAPPSSPGSQGEQGDVSSAKDVFEEARKKRGDEGDGSAPPPPGTMGGEPGGEQTADGSMDGESGMPGDWGMPGEPSQSGEQDGDGAAGESGEMGEGVLAEGSGAEGEAGAEGEGQESGDAAGEGGWETSNEVPGAGQTAGAGGGTGTEGPEGQGGPGGSGDGELDKALEEFDGAILSERAVIASRANETAGIGGRGSSPAAEQSQQLPGGNDQSMGGELPDMPAPHIPRDVPRAPPTPSTAQVELPEDIPDARDDDVVARQLREAAMNEPDPVLREKLWDEYRRYKGGN